MTDLTALGGAEIARLVAAGEISATDVTEAHIKRCEHFAPRINAICVSLFDEARQGAKEIDAARQRGEKLGPLAGVPFTVKECFHVAGTASTMGLTTLRKAIEKSDASLVARLKEAGGILLGKTNVPQLMMLHETDNPLYGRTLSPWDSARTPGGSSGGEGAILAAHGSVLGLGTDLGGSIRIPAHFSGVHGFKPTSFRLLKTGKVKNLRGLESLQFQPGPLARKVEDLELALQVLVGEQNASFDPTLPPVPLRSSSQVDLATLRIGMVEDDEYVAVAPAIRRAVREAAGALRTAGAQVEKFTLPNLAEGVRQYFSLISADGAADFLRLLAGSEVNPIVARLARLGQIPRWLRLPAAGFFRLRGRRKLAELTLASGPCSADRYWQATFAANRYVQNFFDLLRDLQLDAILIPPHALPAVRHKEGGADLLPAACYALLPNLLGVPAGVVAATRVRAGEESDRPATRDPFDVHCRRVESQSVGLPVGVQVFSLPWREDVALAVMRCLEAHFATSPDYPPHVDLAMM